MFTIIDGYNLLHGCGFVSGGVGPGTLRRARGVLLGILAQQLSTEQRQRTTIVFDSQHDVDRDESPLVAGMTVVFAKEYEQADDLIEELIRKHSAPKSLTVVSSDHRLQNAAKRRGAKRLASEDWFEQLKALSPSHPSADVPSYRDRQVDMDEVTKWMREMGFSENSGQAAVTPELPSPDGRLELSDDSIFPPDYAEDILDEEA